MIMAQYENASGYKMVSLTGQIIRENKIPEGSISGGVLVHRAVLFTFREHLEDPKMEGDHINTKKHDNHLLNLQWMTKLENNGKRNGIKRNRNPDREQSEVHPTWKKDTCRDHLKYNDIAACAESWSYSEEKRKRCDETNHLLY